MQSGQKRFSFRIRVIGILLTFQTISLLTYGYVLYNRAEETYRNSFFDRIESVNRTLSITLSPVVETLDKTKLTEILEKIRNENELAYLIYNGTREQIKLGDAKENIYPLDELKKRQNELKILDHFVTLKNRDGSSSEIQIGYDVTPLDHILNALKRQFIFGAILMTLGLGATVFLILHLLFRRLKKIENACTLVSQGDLNATIGDNGNDEIGKIAESFDKMTLAVREAAMEREKQRATLVEASRLSSLGTMAGGVAHEINNPLTIIQLAATRCLSLMDHPESKEKLKSGLEKIQSTVLRISKIVQGLRSFSRTSDGLNTSVESLSSVFDELTQLGSERLKSLGIRLDLNIPADLAVRIDRIQFGQVALNLLNNAVDAICDEKNTDSIDIENRWIRIQAEKNDQGVEIKFIDCGTGLPTEVAAKIMTPFYTTKPIGQGTGLGLSISRGIIESHGGTLTYDDNSTNTTFIIRLPLNLLSSVPPTPVVVKSSAV